MDFGHRDRVLGSDGGDRGCPVHAEGRKRLQVCLDARASARIRAGDGQRNRVFHRDGWSRRPHQYTAAATAMLTRPLAAAPRSPPMRLSLEKCGVETTLRRTFVD